MNLIRQLLFQAEDLLFPRHCYTCGAEIEEGLFCPVCRRYQLELKEWGGRGNIRQGWFLFTYDEGVKDVLRKIKFEGDRRLIRYLAEEVQILCREGRLASLLGAGRDTCMDGLTWCGVPTDAKRREERGFDLPTALFRTAAERSGGRWFPLLCRTRHTEPMFGLGPEERRRNLEDSMALLEDAGGKDIVLTDDIFTTGATLEAAASVLTEGGAATVRCLTFAGSVETLR